MGIQKKRLHHTMNQKKRGNNMIQKYIYVEKEAESSYSFAVGDEVRKSLVAPWRILTLPFSLPMRIITHRSKIKDTKIKPALTECLFILDLEKMRSSDQKAFTTQAKNYSDKGIAIGIGIPKTETVFDHLISTRKELKLEAKEWNSMLEKFLLGLIRSHRPKKLVFVGKYPYAGLMSVLRKCKPENKFFWIHVRGEQDIVNERSKKFHKTIELSHFSRHDNIVGNTIFFDENPSIDFDSDLKECGISIIKNSEHAQYIVTGKKGPDYNTMLMRNQTVFVNAELQSELGQFPDYLLGNLIFYDPNNKYDTILSVIDYRKNVVNKISPITTVEAKLDIWLN